MSRGGIELGTVNFEDDTKHSRGVVVSSGAEAVVQLGSDTSGDESLDFDVGGGHQTTTKPSVHDFTPIAPLTFALFLVFGMGPSWIVENALFIETPWFQQSQPEGLAFASHLAVSGAFALAVVVPTYLLINQNLSGGIPHVPMVTALVCAQCSLALLAALLWPISVGGTSICLMAIAFLASGVGALQTVVVLPWLSQAFNPRLTSVVMSGSNLGTLVAAGLGLLQGPGAERRFTPTIFFLLVFVVLVGPVAALGVITARGLGRVESRRSATGEGDRGEEKKRMGSSQPGSEDAVVEEAPLHTLLSVAGGGAEIEGAAGSGGVPGRGAEGGPPQVRNMSFCQFIFHSVSPPPGWRRVQKHIAINAYIQLITWGLLRTVAPYAAYHTKHHHSQSNEDLGGEVLELAIELSYLALTLGALLSAFLPTDGFGILAGIITGCFIVVLIMAVDFGDWSTSSGAPILVGCICTIRFLDGYVSPLLFRDVAAQCPENPLAHTRFVAAVEKLISFAGAWVIFSLVETGNVAS